MKANKLISILFCCVFATASAQIRIVTQNEALTLLQQQFADRDVDYYTLTTEGETVSSKWEFFVDADPLKGWEHECYVASCPRFTNNTGATPNIQLQRMNYPPDNIRLAPIAVTEHYGSNKHDKPYVVRTIRPDYGDSNSSPGERTYAVILSGGINPSANHERYWNDCSFIYQTLRRNYEVPKQNIYVAMSDGTDPGIDMFTVDRTYKSSPLDLDEDGLDDIRYAATLDNIESILNELGQKMNYNDHLFFYAIDHGGRDSVTDSSYIHLWNHDILKANRLAQLLKPLSIKGVNINMVLGQCYSGGFIDAMQDIDCVIATACGADQVSWACHNRPYDEFVYQWTCAISKLSPSGQIIDADLDRDGSISMNEAFYYAMRHDSAFETPQFHANPYELSQLYLDRHSTLNYDLFVRDNNEDTGEEPNLTTDIFWDSPDLWVRNENDSIHWNEHPYYSKDHKDAYIYVYVHNRGNKTYYSGRYAALNWAHASTAISNKAWAGLELYNGVQSGMPLYGAPLNGPIRPGEAKKFEIRWPLEAYYFNSTNEDEQHTCIKVRIQDNPFPLYSDSEPDFYDIRNYRTMAQRNVTLTKREDLNKNLIVFVRNVHKDDSKYTLEIKPRQTTDQEIFRVANVNMRMSTSIYQAWSRGGLKSVDISRDVNNSPETLRLLSSESKVQDICMNGNEFDKIAMKFDFKSFVGNDSIYTFDLIQRDENGNIVGGETFIVESPRRSFIPLPIDTVVLYNGAIKLNTTLEDTGSLTWYDASGNKIGTQSDITVKPTENDNTYSVVAISSDGVMSKGSISLTPQHGIRYISPEGNIENEITIGLYEDWDYTDGIITISSLTTGAQLITRSIKNNGGEMHIDTSAIPAGIYVLTYTVGGESVYSHKFTKK